MSIQLRKNRHKVPNYVLNAKWDCIEKCNSRVVTINRIYEKVYGRKSIPEGEQYWSMCGAHFNSKEILQGEYGHLTHTGVIKPHQYYGVDIVPSIIEGNKLIYPNTNWILGDFRESMSIECIKNTFYPAIVNYDGVLMSEFGMNSLKPIMQLLDNNVSKKVMVLSNFILSNPYMNLEKYRSSASETLEHLAKIYLLPDHWHIIPQAYIYSSPSRGAITDMGIIIFVKEEHDITNIKYTQNRKIGI